MRVLVTGAGGYIGGRLVEGLCAAPWCEAVVGLDIKAPALAHPKFTFVEQDVRAPLEAVMAGHGIDAVAHLAYVLPPLHDTALMESINVGGTRNVLDACAAQGVRRILYTSSATAYGFWPDNDIPLTEQSLLRGNDDFTYAKNKKEIEAIITTWRARHAEASVAVLRPVFVVGPGFDNPLARHLLKPLVLLPGGGAPMQFVHEDDLLRQMLICLERGVDGAYNVGAPGAMTLGEMVRMLGGRPLFLPAGLVWRLNAAAWALRLGFITEFPSPSLNLMLHSWVVDSAKLERDLGFVYQYDSRAAFADFARSRGRLA